MKQQTTPKIKYIPMEKIENMTFEELRQAGLIRETKLMYQNIREETQRLVDQGLRLDDIVVTLGNKYFKSPMTIRYILYSGVER